MEKAESKRPLDPNGEPKERYGLIETQEGFYVFDALDDRLVGEAFPNRLLAEMEVMRRNRSEVLQESIFRGIREERLRQDEKYGRQATQSSGAWLATLVEEVGEVAESLLKHKNPEKVLERELYQVAATAVAWLEDIERSR